MLVWKSGNDAGKKDFVATVRDRTRQTTGIVAQKGDATSPFGHVDKISPTTSDRVVMQNGGATSSIIHMRKLSPATGGRVVSQNSDTMSSIKHVGKISPDK